jgi:hypothetical protein
LFTWKWVDEKLVNIIKRKMALPRKGSIPLVKLPVLGDIQLPVAFINVQKIKGTVPKHYRHQTSHSDINP